MIRLATMPMPHVATRAHSVLDIFLARNAPENMQCATPSPDVINSQDVALTAQTEPDFHISPISHADFDHLFLAIQTRLATTVIDPTNQTAALPPQDQKLEIRKVVLECVDALGHLHHSLTLERQSTTQR